MKSLKLTHRQKIHSFDDISIVNGVVFECYNEKMYVSFDRCKTFIETNMFDGLYGVYGAERAYIAEQGVYVAVPSQGSWETSLYCISTDAVNWEQKSGSVSVILIDSGDDYCVSASSSVSGSPQASKINATTTEVKKLTALSASVSSGSSAPTTSTVGNVGSLYVDGSGYAYICTSVSGGVYTWKKMSLS